MPEIHLTKQDLRSTITDREALIERFLDRAMAHEALGNRNGADVRFEAALRLERRNSETRAELAALTP